MSTPFMVDEAQYKIGDQPCPDFKPDPDTSYILCEVGEVLISHECPKCGKGRIFCANCNHDHHQYGWQYHCVARLRAVEGEGMRDQKASLHKLLTTSGWGEDEDNLLLLQAALAEAVAYGKIMEARAEKAEAERDALKARVEELEALLREAIRYLDSAEWPHDDGVLYAEDMIAHAVSGWMERADAAFARFAEAVADAATIFGRGGRG